MEATSKELSIACENNDKAKVDELIKAGVNLDQPDDENDCTPLYIASSEGYIGIVESLIKGKADLDKSNGRGITPLYIASNHGNIGIVKALINANANVNHETENGWTPLLETCCEGYEECADLLIRNSANINHRSKSGETALGRACYWSQVKMVEFLLSNDADPHLTDHKGQIVTKKKLQDGIRAGYINQKKAKEIEEKIEEYLARSKANGKRAKPSK